MAFVTPQFTKGQVNRAGEVLAQGFDVDPFADDEPFTVHDRNELDRWFRADQVLANWRGCHAYPINTFQATLRAKLKTVDPEALVAQRLKRAPSIIAKLQRFQGMQLSRMQDIGGLRAVVSTMKELDRLIDAYKSSHFAHEQMPTKDYITSPKDDGYRSIHLIYRYRNDRVPVYNGLSVELQVRTKMQHAWATAVETMGTYLGQALKSGQGDADWKLFFKTASAALALLERTAPVPGFEFSDRVKVYSQLAKLEKELNVLEKLRGFAIATDKIHTARGTGTYHLIVLNSTNKSVAITPYPMTRLDEATKAYAEVEARAKDGESLEAVLVSAGPIDALRKAYPNYFLDTQVFIDQIERFIVASRKAERASAS